MIRLIANLLTEDLLRADLKSLKQYTSRFFESAIKLLKIKEINKSEECLLNIVACFTNYLFYDVSSNEVLPEETGHQI